MALQDTPAPTSRRRSGIYAIASSCCGVTGETVLTDSAVIILFAAAMGAGDMLSLITTAVLPLFNGCLIIPVACLASYFGRKKLIVASCASAICMYLLAASAPLFGAAAMPVLIGAILVFAASLSGFIACWFPLLDSFLLPKDRTGYLAKMRLCHQLSALLFLLCVSYCIGSRPSVRTLQIVLYAAAVVFSGRLFFLLRIPQPGKQGGCVHRSCVVDLRNALANRPMLTFSLYEFILNLLSYGSIPVTILFLKNTLGIGGNLTVLISDSALLGMSLGYLMISRLIRRFSPKRCFLGFHIAVLLLNLVLFSIHGSSILQLCLLSLMLMVCGFSISAGSVIQSAEMMRLSTTGNKTMDMAIGGALFYGGMGGSRLLSSFFLKQSLPEVTLCGITFSKYHWLFLGYALLLIPALYLALKIPAMTRNAD